uniref:Uncharacterized protein n=1 Tax=Chrysotila carterae TaxID=13221 RepID=A0A7S4BYD7_CHRCT
MHRCEKHSYSGVWRLPAHQVPELHALCVDALAQARLPESGPECEFICGDAIELLKQPSSDREPPDVVFAYSTAFASNGVELTDFSLACAFLPVGSRVVTTDKLLVSEEDAGWRFDLLATLDGPNRETGGSTGYVWEVGRSLRNDAQVHS